MWKKHTLFIICVLLAVFAFSGCGENKNSQLVGEWVPSTACINGETVKYEELELEENKFSLVFEENGNCRLTLAGVTHETTYTFNDTSVDIELNGESHKLTYENSTLTFTFDYGTEVTTFTFKKVG
ncbi:MAG: hypothetical protein U0L76_00565 [Ruminococcus sp.]|nr:hypothetical protein [Ruminococcus sp.]